MDRYCISSASFGNEITYYKTNLLDMSSVVKNLILKYQKYLDQSIKQQQARCSLISQHFMAIITLLCLSDQQMVNINQKKLQNIANELLQIKSAQQKLRISQMKQILGFYIRDLFMSQNELENIKSEFQLCYEQNECDQFQRKGDVTVLDDDGQDFAEFLSGISKQSQYIQSSFGSFFNRRESHIKNDTYVENTHSKQVIKYLSQLSTPQTQLGYLCQDMGWNWMFSESASESSGQFIVFVTIHFDYKTIKKELVQSHKAKNKKSGRMVASFKMLKRIYISFPQIWNHFQGIKIQKSIILNRDTSQSIRLMSQNLFEEPVQVIYEVKEKDNQINREKEAYISNIKNFKTELNLLVQHNPMVINCPKMQKIQNGPGGQWNVNAQLLIKYKGKEKIYKEVNTHINSRIAQEQNARKLLQRMYEDFGDILQKMMMIKKKKGIST